jgi:hypothetical protein
MKSTRKAISSEDLFIDNTKTEEIAQRFSALQGATQISSDQLFGNAGAE